jgi:type I restriction enzyme M protein
MSDVRVTKKTPFTLELFNDFFKILPKREISSRSWIVDVKQLEARKYDLKAVNPHQTFVDNFGNIDELVEEIEAEMETISKLLNEARSW